MADQDKNKVLDSVDTGDTTEPTSEHGVQFEEPRKPSRFPFFRSTLFQIFVVGMCSFCSPGIWSAMNSLGVGGSQSPQLVNTANAILYAFMTITCFLGPWLTNLIGFRYSLAIGTVGYPLYAAGLYVNNRTGATWMIYFGSIVCGIGAGIFWSVEGAIATGYPEHHKRGRYVATWFTFRDFGKVVGGSISLAMNVGDSRTGAVSYSTYLGFIAIQCLGLFFALLLSEPEQVRREDGTKISAPRGIHWWVEAKAMWYTTRTLLPLFPLFIYFGWVQAYPGTFAATYFTVRSRALGSLLAAPAAMFGTWLTGLMLDVAWIKDKKKRTVITYIALAITNTATWVWLVILQDEYRFTHPVIDWSGQREFARGFGAWLLERISGAMVENYIYWSIGSLSDSPGDQIRYSSVLRGVETAAVAVGFGIQAVPTALLVTAGINLALWCIALPFSYYATLRVLRHFSAHF